MMKVLVEDHFTVSVDPGYSGIRKEDEVSEWIWMGGGRVLYLVFPEW